MHWFSKECRQEKEEALQALRKWKNEKTKENICKYVEKRIQYKVIIENEKKKWQEIEY
jgi:galactose-1-phosphate uridylyltransferase